MNGPICRRCIRAGYKCQSKDELDRAWQQAHKAERKTSKGKPKGMHWKTYEKLLDKTTALTDYATELGGERLIRTYYRLFSTRPEALQNLLP